MMEVDWLPHCSLHVFSCNRRAQLSAPRMKSKRRWVGSRQLPALPCPAWLHFHPAGVRHPACARNCWLVQEGVNAALDLAGTVSCPLHTLWLPAPSFSVPTGTLCQPVFPGNGVTACRFQPAPPLEGLFGPCTSKPQPHLGSAVTLPSSGQGVVC